MDIKNIEFLVNHPIEGVVRLPSTEIIKNLEARLIGAFAHMIGSIRFFPAIAGRGEYFEDDLFCYEACNNQEMVNYNIITAEFAVDGNKMPFIGYGTLMYETDPAYQGTTAEDKAQNHAHYMPHSHISTHKHDMTHSHTLPDYTTIYSTTFRNHTYPDPPDINDNTSTIYMRQELSLTQIETTEKAYTKYYMLSTVNGDYTDYLTYDYNSDRNSSSVGGVSGNIIQGGYPEGDDSYMYSSRNGASGNLTFPPMYYIVPYVITKIKRPFITPSGDLNYAQDR